MTTDSWTIEYGDGPKLVEDVPTQEVLTYLREVHRDADRPLLFNIAAGEDKVLTIGLGAKFSALGWIDENDADQPYVRSAGEADGDEPSEWWLGNQPSELPPGTGIPVADAVAAVEEFLRSSERPTNVEWVE